ncbi:ferredoxin [Arthrobacter sp. A5]|uniref:ferredoxin n=1 Tax=Arthrobacter sp. A5 TaxID=576926 RepID=UPI003DA836E5
MAPNNIDAPSSAGRISISVDNNHCHLFGLCQQEAPQVFALGPDGRLRYTPAPSGQDTEKVLQAARICPMQAISITGRNP